MMLEAIITAGAAVLAVLLSHFHSSAKLNTIMVLANGTLKAALARINELEKLVAKLEAELEAAHNET